jgi:hypothetical protein
VRNIRKDFVGTVAKPRLLAAVCAAVLGFGLAAPSFGALLVSFKPVPVSKDDAELSWTGSNLVPGLGSIGNNDGINPVVGGLQIDTPFTINDAAHGGVVNAGGTTTFNDVTLELTGLAQSGAASSMAGIVLQPIGTGTFRLMSKSGPTQVELLTGNISNGNINGILNTSSGAVLSGDVTYTGGEIYAAWVAAGGAAAGGSLAFSLLDISPPLTTGIVPPRIYETLSKFDANATGLFSGVQVPEPASFGIVGLSLAGLGIRRRTRKA